MNFLRVSRFLFGRAGLMPCQFQENFSESSTRAWCLVLERNSEDTLRNFLKIEELSIYSQKLVLPCPSKVLKSWEFSKEKTESLRTFEKC